jgi:hypothetical protein
VLVDTMRFALHPLAAPIKLANRLRNAWVGRRHGSDAA